MSAEVTALIAAFDAATDRVAAVIAALVAKSGLTAEEKAAFQAEVDQLDFKSYYEQEMKRVSDMKLNDPDAIQAEIEKVLATAQEINSKKSKRYLSEDYWFCQKAQEANIKTWFCPWMRLQHVGSYIFGGSLADLAAIGASATADPSARGKTKVNRKPER